MKGCAPAGCVVCRYPAATVHERYGVVHESCVDTAAACWAWLSVLAAGSLGGCLVCRGSTIWSHPVHGAVHPTCVARAMSLFDVDASEDEPVRPLTPVAGVQPRRGAYARHAARTG